MTPFDHPLCNDAVGAPHGWDHDAIDCVTLPIARARIEGQEAMVSFWQPSAEELELLKAGKPVALYVFGRVHPVIAVTVQE